jgi:hypothetical protein
MNAPMMLNGLKMVVAPVFPKMTLSKSVTVSPEFREEMDAWMLEFFGTTCLVERGKAWVMQQHGTIALHPDDYVAIRQMNLNVRGIVL